MSPSPEEVRAQLERILVSAVFAGAGRASSLLRFLVARTLAGDADQLKEYVVGVELFERGDQFDPRTDTIVRVEARRLRAKLDEYYRGPGSTDPVTIEIPRGSYAALFAARPVDGAHDQPPLATGATPRSTSIPWAMGGVLAAAVILGGWFIMRTPEASTPGVRVAVLPMAHFSSDADVALVAARLTDGVTTELARIDRLSVVSRSSAAGFASERQPIREVARALGVDIVMEGSVMVEAGGVHAVVRLVDATRDQKVWVGEYDSPPDQLAALQRRIASEAAAAILERGVRK